MSPVQCKVLYHGSAERLGVQWFVFKPQIVKRLVKSMESERYD